MAPLDKKLFSGKRNLTPEEICELEVVNFTNNVDDELTQHGWNKTAACGSIGLHLAIDNNAVEGGLFIVRGQLGDGRQVSMEAAKIWQGADSRANLILRIRDAGIFTFSEGGMASDIIDGKQVEYGMVAANADKQTAPIMENDMEEWGFRGFALRLLCRLSKRSSVKEGVVITYTVILYPMWKEQLLEKYELAQNPAWPGLKVLEGHFPMAPKPRTAWGCPISPWLRMEVSAAEEGAEIPDSDILREAVGKIMDQQATAESCRSGPSLLAKWDRLRCNPDDLSMKPPEVTWPGSQQNTRNPDTGKYPSQIYYY